MNKKYSILFACIGNSCRSQMAEGFAKKFSSGMIEIQSAGTNPGNSVDPKAIEVMKELDIDISQQKPKLLNSIMIKKSTHFISMGCGVIEACPISLYDNEVLDWTLEDPHGKKIEFFRKTRDIIEKKVKNFLESIGIEN